MTRRTHAAFLDAMRTRLAAADLPELAGLTTRDPADFSLALLDAWATVADVLDFYDERITAELFLGTATERRSLVELARLVGYAPRPGLAATTHLAFTMEVGAQAEVPAGTRVQNVPAQGRLPQSFETSAALAAREELNRLGLRTRRPQLLVAPYTAIWLRGTATGLAPDDGVLIEDRDGRTFHRVQAVDVDTDGDRTQIWLDPRPAADPTDRTAWATVRDTLTARPPAAPVEPDEPELDPVGEVRDTDVRQAALGGPELLPALYRALGAVQATGPSPVTVYALRVKARVFGHNALRKPTYFTRNSVPHDPADWIDWDQSWIYPERLGEEGPEVPLDRFEEQHRLHLDRVYDGIQDGTFVVLVPPGRDATPLVTGGPARPLRDGDRPAVATATGRATYGLTGSCTVLDLGAEAVDGDEARDRSWWPRDDGEIRPPKMSELRETVVYTASERLELADEPVTDPVEGAVLELDGVYAGLEPGRLLAVSGKRHIAGIPGVAAAEVVRIADVVHVAARLESELRSADRNRTVVVLVRPLRHSYVRDTVVVAGNVVEATQGETKSEVLGSGDASVAGQRFPLRSGPVTHVPATTPSGAEVALEVRVDDVEWPLRPTPVGLGPDDRGYLLSIDDVQAATIVGLDGRWGRRFPSGVENVRARYRVGLGRAGNVDAGTITLLATKPLGVAGVANPVPATGGADPESDDDLRRNVAVPLKALDRLVSVPDYADFARAFAGIGKASADRLVVGGRSVVVVTVAGADDAPIGDDAALRADLARALRRFGDPTVGVRVVMRERLVVRLHLEVTIEPDRDWPTVAGQVAAALRDALSFDRRDLGQDVVGSEILAAAHRVPGVRGCRIATLTTEPPPPPPPEPPPPPPEPPREPGPRIVVLPARGGDAGPEPAQLAYLAPELPEYLVLTQGGDR